MCTRVAGFALGLLAALALTAPATAATRYGPAIAFDGTNYLVAWEVQGAERTIWAARVRPSGEVIDERGIHVANAGPAGIPQEGPAVAFDGTNYLVVWSGWASFWNYDIYAARVTPDGDVLDEDAIHVGLGHQPTEPTVAFGGATFLVLWSNLFEIQGARVSSNGSVLDDPPLLIAAGQRQRTVPRLAFDGTNYLAAWFDQRLAERGDIFAARIGVDGTVLDPTGIHVSNRQRWDSSTAVAFGGTRYLVVWEEDENLAAGRLATSGLPLDGAGFPVSRARNLQFDPAVAHGTSSFLGVWADDRSPTQSGPRIYGTRISYEGVVRNPRGRMLTSSSEVVGHRDPALAFGTDSYLLVWVDERSYNQSYLFAMRISETGSVLGSPFQIPRDLIAPRTRITGGPSGSTTRRMATFYFRANERSTFQCRLDDRDWQPCSSPRTYRLRVGRHVFRVRAIDRAGNIDRTPAQRAWRIT